MTAYPRYAIYFVPPADGSLYQFGAGLLGYDAYSGQRVPFAGGISEDFGDWPEWTADPSKYGFHATLKAPFSLAERTDETQLVAALHSFADTPRSVPVIAPVVRTMGGFVAIVPDQPLPALQRLAEDCVTAFDAFRAPLTEHDRARRNAAALTPQQAAHLNRWGYPYVFDEFRFHMTLTGSIPDERRAGVAENLQTRFARLSLHATPVDHVALLRQNDATSHFTIVSHMTLRAKV